MPHPTELASNIRECVVADRGMISQKDRQLPDSLS
jgi:hypothetical protein